MGLCCGGNKKDQNKIYKNVIAGASENNPGDAPQLSDIEIFDVNDLVHDRWQYSLKQGG